MAQPGNFYFPKKLIVICNNCKDCHRAVRNGNAKCVKKRKRNGRSRGGAVGSLRCYAYLCSGDSGAPLHIKNMRVKRKK